MNPADSSHGIFAGPALRAQPDGRLVKLAREGCRPAIEEIVRRYRPALLRYAATIVPPDRADDVVQNSLARALPAIESSDRELHLRGWLYTIVHNTALNELRDAGPLYEKLSESYDGVEQPPQALERRESVRTLVARLQRLPQPQRDALVKRELEGMSHAQIAVDLGVSAGAARQLIFRARNALRSGLGGLVPMPVLRLLVECGTAAEAGAAGGGAFALKATVAILATGAAVTAGVAIRSADHHRSPAVAHSGAGDRPDSMAAPLRSPLRAPSSDNRSPSGGLGRRRGRGEGPVRTDGVGGDGIGPAGGTAVSTGSPGTWGQGHATSGGGTNDPNSRSGGGSLSGAAGDGSSGQTPGDPASAVTTTGDSPQAAGGDSSGGTSTDSTDVATSGGGGGATSGDGSTNLSSEAQTETTSGDPSGDVSGTD